MPMPGPCGLTMTRSAFSRPAERISASSSLIACATPLNTCPTSDACHYRAAACRLSAVCRLGQANLRSDQGRLPAKHLVCHDRCVVGRGNREVQLVQPDIVLHDVHPEPLVTP